MFYWLTYMIVYYLVCTYCDCIVTQKPSSASQADSPVNSSSRRSPVPAVPSDIASISAKFCSLLARFPDRRLPVRWDKSKSAALVMLWVYSSAAINTDMNGKIYGALVQFGCYQHRYEWKVLWCSSTVRLLSSLEVTCTCTIELLYSRHLWNSLKCPD